MPHGQDTRHGEQDALAQHQLAQSQQQSHAQPPIKELQSSLPRESHPSPHTSSSSSSSSSPSASTSTATSSPSSASTSTSSPASSFAPSSSASAPAQPADMLSLASPVDADAHRHKNGHVVVAPATSSSLSTTAESSSPLDSPTSPVVQGLKDYLVFRIKGRLPGRGGPDAFPWYHPDHVPSPAAFYTWRRDQCSRYRLPLGSLHDEAFWTHFVKVNYDESIHARIRQDQHRYEEYLERTRISEQQSAATPMPQPADRVEWITCGVAEAIRRHPPLEPADNGRPSAPAATTTRNRKNLPTALYAERNKFHDEWHNYCRTHGSASQNTLYDYVAYASHNPYSLYHRVKYGDYGSPHPYVPFAITNPTEFLRSQQLQRTEEAEAIAWIAERRHLCPTQAHLDQRAQQVQAQEEEQRQRGQCQDDEPAMAPLSTSPTDDGVVPVNISDEAVIDQEVEQPQAMKMGGSSSDGDGQEMPVPTIATSAKAPEQAQSQAQPQPQSQAQSQSQSQSQSQPQLPPLLTPAPNVAAATSQSHPITVSILVPETLMPWIRTEIWHQLQRDHPEKLRYYEDDSQRRLPWPKSTSPSPSSPSSLARLKPVINLAAVATDDEAPWRATEELRRQFGADDSATAKACALAGPLEAPRWVAAAAAPSNRAAPPASFQIGNMYLSSCPGKKVRLTGAVRGRGAVCRDLGIDLVRFKTLNVGTVVCCLSDAELAVIGVKWQDYVYEADKLGLDLLRIPMVEGNCPTSHESIDAWLDEIIEHCTLKGVNVLVHCRGGVGRAGTLAACWLIKMGFVDEFRPEEEQRIRGHLWQPQELMWQCLQIVRLRRSSKAIETAEQAHFIAQYGEYILDRWAQEHPSVPALDASHCRTVEAYWARLREEARTWIASEEERARREAAQGRGRDGNQAELPHAQPQPQPNGHAAAAAAAAAPYHSNVNAKHAATVPASSAGIGGGVAAAAFPSTAVTAAPAYVTTQVNGSGSGNGNDSINGSGSGNDVAHPGRGQDGEPSRKRRNTLNMAGMAGMHLGDESGTGVGVGAGVGAAQASIPEHVNGGVAASEGRGQGRAQENDRDAAATGLDPHAHEEMGTVPSAEAGVDMDLDLDLEMDAFPVNGRRHDEAQEPQQRERERGAVGDVRASASASASASGAAQEGEQRAR